MNRLLSNHADHVARPTDESDALAHQHLRIPSANRGDVDQSTVVDIRGDDAYFVDVTGQHDDGTASCIHRRQAIPHDVGRDLGE